MVRLMPPYRGYNPDVDPSIANVFATAAFRFAHVTVQPVVTRLGPGYTTTSQHPPLPLHNSLFASWRIVQEGRVQEPSSWTSGSGVFLTFLPLFPPGGPGGIDPVLRGLLLSPAKLQTPGQMMVEELTERLFQAQGGMPFDLAALNLQRGRDHGLPGTDSPPSFSLLETPLLLFLGTRTCTVPGTSRLICQVAASLLINEPGLSGMLTQKPVPDVGMRLE